MRFEGRREVERRRQKLKGQFALVSGQDLPPELLSRYSRYLCVLVSGYAEQSAKELAGFYCKARANAAVHRYVRGQLGLVRNIDLEKLRKLIQAFDTTWWDYVELEYEAEIQAFGSVATVRNSVSHGGDSGITLVLIRQYFDQIDKVVSHLCDRFDPSI